MNPSFGVAEAFSATKQRRCGRKPVLRSRPCPLQALLYQNQAQCRERRPDIWLERFGPNSDRARLIAIGLDTPLRGWFNVYSELNEDID